MRFCSVKLLLMLFGLGQVWIVLVLVTLFLRSIQIGRTIEELQFKIYCSEIQGTFSMGHREQGSLARGVYPTQGTSCMITVREK